MRKRFNIASQKKYWFIAGLTLILTVSTVYATYVYRPFNHRLAAYVTDLSGRRPHQIHNIRLGSQSIDGIIIPSQESFSFNQKVGPYDSSQGFLPERSFLHGKTIESSGGGICQVSSTLFNSAQLAKLKIIERVLHSQDIQSVPHGQDATVAYGVADLKIINPYSFPIQIRSHISQNQLKIEIWGKELSHELQ
ncbi:MAG: VanW family protein [Deltaproteobacteria bacterium]|nr:VanW family protein [Deltaproteobacteria bacterium]